MAANTRHRRSIRLPGYDYSRHGCYFVTLCTQKHQLLFGDMVDDCIRLNLIGQCVADAWLWLAKQYDYVVLDEWIVMPNHLHGVVVMDDDGGGHKPLGRLIGAFKTVSTKRVNGLRGTPGTKLWQRNYFEHIIRNAPSLNRVREYVAHNPRQWATDRDNPLMWTNGTPLPPTDCTV